MPYTVEEREQIVAAERMRIVQIIEDMRDEWRSEYERSSGMICLLPQLKKQAADEILSAI
jgi:hypothetical protein